MENSFRPWGKKGIEGEILSYQLKKTNKKKKKNRDHHRKTRIRRTCEVFSFKRSKIHIPSL